jgi:hypothetical protein
MGAQKWFRDWSDSDLGLVSSRARKGTFIPPV